MSEFSNEVNDTFDLEAREAARREEQKARERAEHQLDTDYSWLMESFAGRRIMFDLLAPMWRSSYMGSREDTDFREGERNVALRVWARLTRVSPTLAHKMLEENQR